MSTTVDGETLAWLTALSRGPYAGASRQADVDVALAILAARPGAVGAHGFFAVDAGAPGPPHCLGGTCDAQARKLLARALAGPAAGGPGTPHWQLGADGSVAWVLIPAERGRPGLVWLAAPGRSGAAALELAAALLAAALDPGRRAAAAPPMGTPDGRPPRGEYKRIIESIPQLLWRTNLDGSADYVSLRFAAYLGYPRAAMMGWGWTEIIDPADRPAVLSAWAAARARDGGVTVEFRARLADGTQRWFLSMGSPYRDRQGRSQKYYGTWTDIEDAKRVSLERERVLVETQAAVRARDTFLAVASHELKTPLTPLKLEVQRLARTADRQHGGDAAALRARVARTAAACDAHIGRVAGLVDDLLDVTRIAGGVLALLPADEDLRAIVADVLHRHGPEATAAGCEVRADLGAPLRGLWDRARLGQVVANLLLNAVKYAAGSPIAVSLRAEAGAAVLEVADRGCGIPAADRERIFESFERLVAPGRIGGLGLGLFITRQIVVAHGGRIDVTSKFGVGSTFMVTLPIRPHSVT